VFLCCESSKCVQCGEPNSSNTYSCKSSEKPNEKHAVWGLLWGCSFTIESKGARVLLGRLICTLTRLVFNRDNSGQSGQAIKYWLRKRPESYRVTRDSRDNQRLPQLELGSVQPMPVPMEITPQEVMLRLKAGEKLYLIDVREPHEYALARIEGSELIPMRTIPAAFQQLEARADEAPLIVYCHHGVRSLNVVKWLREQSVAGCHSMSGGIDTWSLVVDPAVPRY
jgi:rhodanese-related sulfurtransferase